MTDQKIVMATLKSTPNLALLTLSLAWTYFTLDRKVHKARRAFEKQLTSQGMSKQNAQQLSQFLEDLKNEITNALKQGLTGAVRQNH